MVETAPERIFALNAKIRSAGLATEQGEVLFATMRPGIDSVSPEDTDREFMQLGPMLLCGVCERLAPWAGPLEVVVSRYKKVTMFVRKLDKLFLAMTINSEDIDDMHEIMESLQQLNR